MNIFLPIFLILFNVLKEPVCLLPVTKRETLGKSRHLKRALPAM
jgi:hypothetical protein